MDAFVKVFANERVYIFPLFPPSILWKILENLEARLVERCSGPSSRNSAMIILCKYSCRCARSAKDNCCKSGPVKRKAAKPRCQWESFGRWKGFAYGTVSRSLLSMLPRLVIPFCNHKELATLPTLSDS